MKKLSLFFVAAFLLSMTAYAGLVCDNVTPCKYTGPGCANLDCVAIKFQLGQDLTLRISASLYAMPTCQGGSSTYDFTVDQTAGDVLLFLPVDNCPAGAPFSAKAVINQCEIPCADFVCGDPDTPINCADVGAAELPAINILDLR